MTGRADSSRRVRPVGFTLLELMIVIGIIAILATIGVPVYQAALSAARNLNAASEIKNIASEVDRFIVANGHPPDSLADVGMADILDEWGNPYQYLRIDNLDKKGKKSGKVRKDRNLHPINSDYDLYSMGPDGKTTAPLTAKISHDDIIRAQNGNYFGRAVDY